MAGRPAAALEVVDADPASDAVQGALARYFEELSVVFGRPFAPEVPSTVEAARYAPPHGACLVARLDARIVGTASLTPLAPRDDEDPDLAVGEVKRMWVDPDVRGHGVGRALLAALEDRARDLGMVLLRLDTNGALTAALGLYERAGYVHVERYNDNPHATHFLERRLDGDQGGDHGGDPDA